MSKKVMKEMNEMKEQNMWEKQQKEREAMCTSISFCPFSKGTIDYIKKRLFEYLAKYENTMLKICILLIPKTKQCKIVASLISKFLLAYKHIDILN